MAEEHTTGAIAEGHHQPLLGLGCGRPPRRADQQGGGMRTGQP